MNEDMKHIIDKLYNTSDIDNGELKLLLEADDTVDEYLYHCADTKRQEIYGREVFLRGLIEFTNYCKNNC